MGVFRVFTNLLFAGVFALGAYVQQNDPDPERWIAIYSAPAAIATLSILRVPMLEYVGFIVGVLAMLWAGQLWPAVLAEYQKVGSLKVLLLGKTPEFTMTASNGAVEEAREFGGLLIIVVYCIILYPLMLKPSKGGAKSKKE